MQFWFDDDLHDVLYYWSKGNLMIACRTTTKFAEGTCTLKDLITAIQTFEPDFT